MQARKGFTTNRKVLVEHLLGQYGDKATGVVKSNIEALLRENTFTICTAHQPNIFTGPLYFIYKIVHAIKLADVLKKEFPENHFVPVFYVGSEDADLEELNHIFLEEKRYTWNTKQTGAVGRMQVDKGLTELIQELESRLLVEPFGKEISDLLKKCYAPGTSISDATFLFVHELFQQYGLIILLAESHLLKNEMISIFEDELFNHRSAAIVEATSEKLAAHYKVQANPREINLFYFTEGARNRILATDNGFEIQNQSIFFTKEEMKNELKLHPEKFSPNVILRALYQEKILPDIAWIGGGGELAYWLQLKDLFHLYQVPFPVLVVRNSFLIIPKRIRKMLQKLELAPAQLFESKDEILKKWVLRNSKHQLSIEDLEIQLQNIYDELGQRASKIDVTLLKHAAALKHNSIKGLKNMEKKMIRAEKRKFEDTEGQLIYILNELFPQNGLQERKENFLLMYAAWGAELINTLYRYSGDLQQEFCVIQEN